MLFQYLSLLACAVCTTVASNALVARKQCAVGYDVCVAKGSTSGKPPAVGPEMRDLYTDVVNSINSAANTKRDIAPWPEQHHAKRDDLPDLCCKGASGLQCLLLEGFQISFCWDRFTTNYQFADGSYGSVTTGIYNTASDDVVNLIIGNYTLSNGETGNIYEGDDGSQPNTSTMDLPTPWTSEGVGTVIPGSELGSPATFVTTIEGTTKPATTIPATTVPESTVSGSIVVPATTIPPSTIAGQTMGPETVTVTADGGGSLTATPTAPDNPNLAGTQSGGLGSWITMIMTAICGFLI